MRTTLLALLLAFCLNASSQIFNKKTVKELLTYDLIIGLGENEEENQNLIKAVNQFWDLTKIKGEMPKKEAIAQSKTENSMVIFLDTYTSRSTTTGGSSGMRYYNFSVGTMLKIKKGLNTLVYQIMPSVSEGPMPLEFTYFGVGNLVDLLSSIKDGKITNSMGASKLYRTRTGILAKDVLVINKNLLADDVTIADIRKVYGSNVKVVPSEEWSKTITERKEGHLYCIPISQLAGGEVSYLQYVMDADSGICYGIANKPKLVMTPTVDDKQPYVNQAILKRYAELKEMNTNGK